MQTQQSSKHQSYKGGHYAPPPLPHVVVFL